MPMLMTVKGAYLNEKEVNSDEGFISDRIQPYLNRLSYVTEAQGQKVKVRDDRVRLVSCWGDFCNTNSLQGPAN